ncbi:ATP-binding protein [Streptomyces litchfieldiae]|uniref:ATP-binding protein n=1 Tax=Streptomyces litchfieldiae TaxID=3075543 RepID=A0ABU2MLM3_9ACTN|nr:ATP-binding protein [Streptomyces sp. DSM 44938]MDT0342512.1 ATP-binding protein [Streptomyces sp. DSM 44938]
MSNPVARRLAKAAFLLAAGAAPVLGAAGQAAAADDPLLPDLGGLTKLDDDGLGDTVDRTGRSAAGLAEDVGDDALRTAAPIVMPLAHEVGASTATTTGALVHDVATTLSHTGPTPDEVARALPSLEDPDMHALTL